MQFKYRIISALLTALVLSSGLASAETSAPASPAASTADGKQKTVTASVEKLNASQDSSATSNSPVKLGKDTLIFQSKTDSRSQKTSQDQGETKSKESDSHKKKHHSTVQQAEPEPVTPPATQYKAAYTNKDLPDQINMHVGEIKILDLKNIDTVAVGSGKVISTAVIHNDDDLMVLAEDAGESSIYIWDKSGHRFSTRIRVNSKDNGRILHEVSEALADVMPPVKIRNIGEKIIVDGKNLSAVESFHVAEVAKAYPQITNLTTGKDVVDKTFADMIHFDLQFLEVKKSALDDIGVKWDSATSGGIFFGLLDDIWKSTSNGFRVIPSSTSGTDWSKFSSDKSTKWYLGSSLTLGSVINLMVSNGDAFVLASPKLTTRRGGKAKFLAGGEIPLATTNSLGVTSITFKEYGIKLTINADWTPDDVIAGGVQAEISAVDSSVSVSGMPGFLTRRTENEFSLHDGETIILSGLMNKEASKAVDKLPLLGSIPILGSFFRNTNDSNKTNELVVFITPRLIKPSSALNKEAIQKGITDINIESQAISNTDAIEAPTEIPGVK